jgi:VCBS repeat-containing protein
VLANDTDADGNTLTAVKVSDPAHGTVTLNSDGSFTYTPSSGYTGTDSFTYQASDGQNDSNNITVNITVEGTPSNPTPAGGGGGGGGISGGGGGGGGVAGITSLRSSTTVDGLMLEDVSATDIDMKLELRIPKGTIIKNIYGQTPGNIRITPKGETSAANSGSERISQSYEIEPSGITFNASAILIYRYSSSEIPEDIPVNNLYLACWDPDTEVWKDLGGKVDTIARTVSTPIQHLSVYALMAHTRPASFETNNLAITPGEAAPGEIVTASIKVDNQGDLSGTCQVSLMLDNEIVQTREVTLAGGGSETVVFTLTSDTVGEHRANIGSMLATFLVKKPLSPANFAVSGLSISPNIADSGKNIDISAIVKNTGDLSGTYQTVLSVDDAAVETKEVVLAGGSSATVSFSFTAGTVGQHKVSIGGLPATFEVKLPPPAGTEVSRPELTGFSTAPSYDQTTDKLAYAKIVFTLNQSRESFPNARLMLTVFHDDQFLEQIPLLDLGELQEDGKTGAISYVPPTGWETGEYSFRAELYDGDSLVQDTPLRKLTVTPESTAAVVSWKTLGIIIGASLALGLVIVTLVLYFRRDMMRDYLK